MSQNKIKIGILSLYYRNPNCGAQLQALALCEALKTNGYEAEQICFSGIRQSTPVIRIIFRKFKIDGLAKTLKACTNKGLSVIDSKVRKKEYNRRRKLFRQFEETVPHSSKVYSNLDIETACNDYDCFITGSDQVWTWRSYNKYADADRSKYGQVLDIYLLRFAPADMLKIAYAPSIACPYIPDNLKTYYFDSISRLDHISIRESGSLSLFPRNLSSRITPVCDPTILLSSEQWKALLKLKEDKQEKYIFVYLLDGNNRDREIIRYVSKELGLKTVSSPNIIMHSRSKEYHLTDVEDFDMGPKEFLQYILNAELVITNSFHATVFSLQFHTPFFLTRRDSGVSMHSRIEGILNEYDLSERLLSGNPERKLLDSFNIIDWDKVDKKVEDTRKNGMLFLLNSLSSMTRSI